MYILLSRIFGILLKLDLHAISDLVKHKDLFGSTIHEGSYIVGLAGRGGGEGRRGWVEG